MSHLIFLFEDAILFSAVPTFPECHRTISLQSCQGEEVSFSPTFYEQLFYAKVFCEAFLYLQFGYIIFGQDKSCP